SLRSPLGRRPLGTRSRAALGHAQQIRHSVQERNLHARLRLRPRPGQTYAARPTNSRGGGIMAKTCKVTVNKESFHAKCGDLLLDAALGNGIDLPHDCRSGVCGSCRISLQDGKVFGGYDGDSGMIYACGARVVSDMRVMVEPVPETVMVNAEVVDMRRMAPDIFAVDLQLQKKLRYLSGQYTKVQFRGFPERCYSPTYPLQGAPKDRL